MGAQEIIDLFTCNPLYIAKAAILQLSALGHGLSNGNYLLFEIEVADLKL